MVQRIFRVLLHVLFWPVLLLFLVAVAIYIPPVQNVIRNKAVGFLKQKIGTEVRLEHFALRFPIGVSITGLYVEDTNGDTLLYAGSIKARAGLRALFKKQILLGGVKLSDVRAVVHQAPDSTFNFNFIIEAFSPKDTTSTPKDSAAAWSFGMENVHLANISLGLDLQPSGMAMDLALGELDIDVDAFDPAKKVYHVNDLLVHDTRVDMRLRAGPHEPPKYPDLTNPLGTFDTRVEGIDMQRIAFTMKTTNTGDSMWLDAKSVSLATKEMDLSRQHLALKELVLDGFHFGMLTASTDKVVKDTLSPPIWLGQNDGFRYFIKDWDISAADLELSDCSFEMHTGSIDIGKNAFDPRHLVFDPIQLDAKDVVINNQRIALVLKELTATSGSKDELNAAFELDATPDLVLLKNGTLVLADTRVDVNATANVGGLDALYEHPEKIPMEIQLGTDLDLQRTQYLLDLFAVKLPKRITSTEILSTEILAQGSLEKLDTVSLKINGDQGSVALINGQMSNAKEWPRSNFNLVVERLTMGAGMEEVVHMYVPAKTKLPRRFSMTAHASGNNGDMRSELDVESDLGNVRGTVSAMAWTDTLPDAAKFDLDVRDIRVAQLIDDTSMGPLSARITGEGSKLNGSGRKAHVSFVPSKLSYRGNDLSAMDLYATLVGDSVFLTMDMESEPANFELTAHGLLPSSNDSLNVALVLDIDTLDLEALGLMQQPLRIDGRILGNAAMDTHGHGRITISGDGLVLANAQQRFRFEHLELEGALLSDSTAFIIDSDALTLDYRTNMPIDSLIPRTREKLESLFSADTAFTATTGKRMDLKLTLPRPELLTGILVPKLQAIQLENFEGHYDSDQDELALNVDLPYLLYDSIEVKVLTVGMNAKDAVLNGNVHVDRIQRGPYFVDVLDVDAVTTGGILTTTLQIQPSDSANAYRIGMVLRTLENIRTLHIEENLVLSGTKWTADPDNLLHFDPVGLRADHFSLKSEQEQVELINEGNNLQVRFKQFQLETITNLISTTDSVPVVQGALDGTAQLPGPVGDQLLADLTIHGLQLIGTEIGTLQLDAKSVGPKKYHAGAKLENTNNRLDAEADVDVAGQTDVKAKVDLDLKDIGFVKPFVSDFLFAINGGVSGNVAYEQRGKDINLNGDLHFNNTEVGVIMTGATYTLRNERLTLDRSGAHFKDFALRDSIGNTFTLNGDIKTATLSNPVLDVGVRTDRFQMIHSSYAQNQLFYGDLVASTDLRITGKAKRPKVSGSIGVLEGTSFSVVLPGSKVKLISSEGIVVFTDELYAKDTTQLSTEAEAMRDSLKANLPGVELDLRIKIDKAAQFAVVLDPTTGDQATVRGSGELVFRYTPDGAMYLDGPFTIAEGGYTLEFYGLVKKRFDLVPGSSVTWSGDPVEATMDIKARYTSNSAPYPLVASSSSISGEAELNQLQQPLPFDVLISISGPMDKTKIDLGLDLSKDLRNSYQKVDDRLDQLAQPGNEEERNRQVFGLLVLNSFIQNEASGGAPSSGIATTAARNSINGLLTDQMNKLTGKYVKGVNVSLGVNTYDQASGNSTYQRTSLDYKVSKRILDDRLSFEVGGSVGVNESNDQVSNVSNTRAAQYAILYDLTRDGRFRIRGFHENSFDLYDGEITNSGVALMLTRDFEENERGRELERQKQEKLKKNTTNKIQDE